MFKNGSEIVRVDFHLHTEKDKEFKYEGNDFVTDYIKALKQADIKIGVITNHNKFDRDEYFKLKKAAKRQGIFLLPGIELSVKEGANGIHTLIIFNPDEWLANKSNHIDSFLKTVFLGVDNYENENTRCNGDLAKCFEELEKVEKDYFVLFAHVDDRSGFFKECSGGLIQSLGEKDIFKKRVLGFQKSRKRDNYNNASLWLGKNLAKVEGSDAKSVDEIGKGDACYIKIGDFNFAAVKYALKDYSNRVYNSVPLIKHGYIKEICYRGGKLEDETILPSPELNTLIGIRGSGKSSIIEVLRYALNLEPATDADKSYKEELVKSVLASGGEVEINYVDKYGHNYVIKRILNEKPVVLDENGKAMNIAVNTVVNNPLYFGQKDLSLTRHGYEMELLERLVGKPLGNKEVDDISKQLVAEFKILNEIEDIPSQIEDLKQSNRELTHKLEIYKEKGVEEKLRKQVECDEDLAKIDNIIAKGKIVLKELTDAFNDDDLTFFDLSQYRSTYNGEIFDAVTSHSDAIKAELKKITITIDKIKAELVNLSQDRDMLVERIDSLKEEFAKIKREINDNTIDLDKFVLYQRNISQNEELIKVYEKKIENRERSESSIKTLIQKRNHALAEDFRSYNKRINEINASQNHLQIEMSFKGDKKQFKEDLIAAFKGTGINDARYVQMSEKFTDFLALLEDYYLYEGKELKKILTENTFFKIAEVIRRDYASLLNIFCPDKVVIKYHGKLLSKYSLGQRASALMLFILTQDDSDVIIIDQPEDDLDNQVIYNELIGTIKKEKRNIQLIFATHNANIPVLGDAEKIIAVEYNVDKDRICLKQGSIDSPESHDSIVNIMEGGREAFEKRNEIYTSWM